MNNLILCNNKHPLTNNWTLWAHIPNNTDWSLKSYVKIMKFNTVEELLLLYENINELFVNNCMLFLMKEDITPLWEDSKNKQGGCFSYKINNKITYNTWKKTSFLLVGCLLTNSISHYNDINGITISPKKSFCILKIWFCNCNNQNPSIIKEESGLSLKGCLFKKHIS
tara:strand:+ start:199 stop:702 length:504 start_codon:yes stop_codon:yes gene_type:complete